MNQEKLSETSQGIFSHGPHILTFTWAYVRLMI